MKPPARPRLTFLLTSPWNSSPPPASPPHGTTGTPASPDEPTTADQPGRRSLIGGQWHARLIGAVPPVMVHDDTIEGLAGQVEARTRQAWLALTDRPELAPQLSPKVLRKRTSVWTLYASSGWTK
jgi:hypothetical protein